MLLAGEPDLELKADTAHGLACTIGDNDTVAVNIFEQFAGSGERCRFGGVIFHSGLPL